MTQDAGPLGDTPGVSVLRPEEQVRVRLRTRPYERVMVRKVVVTEDVTVTVTLRREELQVKRVPASELPGRLEEAGWAQATGSPDADADEALAEGTVLNLVLSAERPVVGVESVPVERVQVSKHIVTRQQDVDAEVRAERVDVVHDPGLPPVG